MDDFVEILTKEQGNANGLLLQVLSSQYENWDYIIAVEGVPDKKFYFDFVRQSIPNASIYFLDCGGKNSVLGLKKSVEEYSWAVRPRFRFLCDKDFDDYLCMSTEGVWYTEKYSIELIYC